MGCGGKVGAEGRGERGGGGQGEGGRGRKPGDAMGMANSEPLYSCQRWVRKEMIVGKYYDKKIKLSK